MAATYKAALPGTGVHSDYPSRGSASDRLAVSAGEQFDAKYLGFSGALASEALRLDISDAATIASGYNRGIYVNYAQAGAKTGSGEVNALGVDMAISQAVAYAYLASLYVSTSGNPAVGLISAMSVYLDNLGTGISSVHMLDLQSGNPSASAPSTRFSFMRIRNHGTGTPTSVLFLQANNNAKAAEYFIEQDSVTVGPVIVSATGIASGTNTTHRVKCIKGTDVFYLLGVAAS